jgi:hypothetical protein
MGFLGLLLVLLGFVLLVAQTVITALKLEDAVAARIKAWLTAREIRDVAAREELLAAGGWPYIEAIRAAFDAIVKLIVTPVGVGMALLILATVLLLGESAIVAGFGQSEQQPSAAPTSTPTSTPTPTPTATPSPT